MPFTSLGLSQPILRALHHEGYTVPTPIQRQTIPHALAGRDLLGIAQTGTGKTAAFALPILQRLAATTDKSRRGPRKARALILAPTRELAAQIAESFAAYGRESHLDCAVIYGGVSQFHQERALAKGVDILVATPGRLIDLMEQRLVDLSEIQILVLDEADRMLDMGFIQPIRRIAAATPAARRQTLLFSATMPTEVARLAHSLLRDPVKVAVEHSVAAAPKIDQAVYMVGGPAKQTLLEHLLAEAANQITRALVFTRTKHGAERLGRRLERSGVAAATIHGNKNQSQRRRALESFRSGRARVLVATDVAARGLDVDGISHVFNFDLPVEPEAYIHRIGRTGRAGATGIALSFCGGEERAVLRDIERLMGRKIEVRPTPALAATAAPDRSDRFTDHHAPRRSHPAPRPDSAPRHREAAPSSHHPRSLTPRPGRAHNGWHKPSRRRSAR